MLSSFHPIPERYGQTDRRTDKIAISRVSMLTRYKKATFCTVEANYWQVRSIARPLCDSRATCFHHNYFRTIL